MYINITLNKRHYYIIVKMKKKIKTKLEFPGKLTANVIMFCVSNFEKLMFKVKHVLLR